MVVLSVASGRGVTWGGGGGGGTIRCMSDLVEGSFNLSCSWPFGMWKPHALRSVEGPLSSTKIALVVFTLAAQ